MSGQTCFSRSFCVQGVAGSFSVQPAADALVATIVCPDPAVRVLVAGRIRRMFDLDADPAAIAAHFAADPVIGRLVAARPGLRVPGAWDGFELAVRAVLGQQITVTGARQLGARLAAGFGTALPAADNPALTLLFPTPAQLIGPALSLVLGMPRSRGATLAAIAAAALDDQSLFEPAADGLAAAVQRLCAVRGIGPWTANYIALRALREPDAFPGADIGLLRAAAGPAGRPTPAALLTAAEAWRPWRGYAAQHLWTRDAALSREAPG